MDDSIQQINSKIEKNNFQLKTIENQLSDLSEEKDKKDKQISLLKSTIQQKNSDINSLESGIKQWIGRKDLLNQEINNKKIPEENKHEEIVQKAKKEIEDIELRVIKLKDEKEKLVNKEKELQKEKQALETQLNEIDSESKNKKAQYSSIDKKNNELNFQLNHINKYKSMLDKGISEKGFLYKVSLKIKKSLGKEKFHFTHLNNPYFLRKFDYNLLKSREYFCDFRDIGFKAVMDRYKFAIKNVLQGFYKNPSIIHNLIEPRKIEENTYLNSKNKIKRLNIADKYNLNKNQIKAITTMDASRDIAYIQGPPGTGKTQVISSFIDFQVQEGNNVLVTSSTHEAIENALERVDASNSKNPSMVIIKKERYTESEDKKSSFSEDKVYENFVNKLKNNFVFVDQEQELCNEFEKEEYKNKLIPWSIYQKLYEKLGIDQNDRNLQNKNYLPLDRELLDKYFKTFSYQEVHKNDFEKFFTKLNEGFEFKEIQDLKMRNFVLSTLEQLWHDEWVIITFDSLNKMIKSKNEYKTINKYQNELISAYFSKNPMSDNSEKFSKEKEDLLEYINENDLINVIGMTTTSSNSFTINKNERDVLSDYPIDVTIVDEVSKSSTPEILTRIVVSNKTILCGDYKQLPPNEELNRIVFKENMRKILNDPEKFETTFIKHFNRNKRDYEEHTLFKKLELESILTELNINWEKYQKIDPINLLDQLNKNNEIQEKFLDKIFEKIQIIFNIPLFAKQVEFIKHQSSRLISYQEDNLFPYVFLNEQHRFNSTIMDFANNFYENQESLKMGNKDPEYNRNKLTLINDEKSDLYYVDTTYLHDNFIEEIQKSNQGYVFGKYFEHNYEWDLRRKRYGSFDQKSGTWIELEDIEKPNLKIDGAFNQYNAITIAKIVEQIIRKNETQIENIKDKIGIICLTTNQKKVILATLKAQISDLNKYKIKVDTIDNFQGREKEIVIVDFVRSKARLFEEKGDWKIDKGEKRNTSFLQKEERLNVAISRARKALVLVGAFEYYKNEMNHHSLLYKYVTHKDEASNNVHISYFDGEKLW